jgi:hypothetical protein
MCYDVVAEFRCADRHEQAGEDRRRLKHIVRCGTALQTTTGATCPPPLRTTEHVLQEDEPEQDCPECKRETPPETP